MAAATSVWPPISQPRRNSKTRKMRFLPRDGGKRPSRRDANGTIATRSRLARPTYDSAAPTFIA
jgi:hypothetical protein